MPEVSRSDLGDFLRACRSKLDPNEVGLPYVGVRRVAGLRREEVAALAGVSADYYTRLEQGRERNPSGQVVEAISRALRLEPDSKEHLFRLAGVIPGTNESIADEFVDVSLRRFMDSLPHPSFIINRVLDVLATNELAKAIFSAYERVDNLGRMLFCDPAARSFLPQWELAAQYGVDMLRLAAGFNPNDPKLVSLVDELTSKSPEFRDLWQTNSARGLTQRRDVVVHPQVGMIEMTSLSFDVRGAPGQQLIVVFTEAGSEGAKSIAALLKPKAKARAKA